MVASDVIIMLSWPLRSHTAHTVVASDVIIMLMAATFAQDIAIVLTEEQ